MASESIRKLDNPIDVMPLIHKAFRAVSERIEFLAADTSTDGGITELAKVFRFWAKQILFHATIEDEVITNALNKGGLVRQAITDNETEHAILKGKAGELIGFFGRPSGYAAKDILRETAFTIEDDQHRELEKHVHEVETLINTALGEEKVTARTIRHAHSQLVTLRVLELDHFENEEAFVCSLVRDEVSEVDQLDMVRRLLIDDTADEPRWVIDWVYSELCPEDQNSLKDLEARIQEVYT